MRPVTINIWPVHYISPSLEITLFSASDLFLNSVLVLTLLASIVANHQSPIKLGGGGAAEHVGVVTPPAQPLAADEAVTIRGVRPEIADRVLCYSITSSFQGQQSILRLLRLIRIVNIVLR